MKLACASAIFLSASFCAVSIFLSASVRAVTIFSLAWACALLAFCCSSAALSHATPSMRVSEVVVVRMVVRSMEHLVGGNHFVDRGPRAPRIGTRRRRWRNGTQHDLYQCAVDRRTQATFPMNGDVPDRRK